MENSCGARYCPAVHLGISCREQTAFAASGKATTTVREAENVRQNTCVGTRGVIVHGVPECRQGSRAMVVAVATFATPTLFKKSPFRLDLARFSECRGGGARIVGIAEVSWAASSCTYAAESPTIENV